MAEVAYFGIRHHGPGSARRLLQALDRLQPRQVLIEGPADLSDLMQPLMHPMARPPLALLAYAEDDPARASFWPFDTYSPEYQAIRWALSHGAGFQFIDLPAAVILARDSDDSAHALRSDPIAALAGAAGHGDPESWWNDMFEVSGETDVFVSVAGAMAALREGQPASGEDIAREAHMRLAIAEAAKGEGPVAVVCGAWHVPALIVPHSKAADRDALKGLPRVKTRATWVPWTTRRLSRYSGYGAGVPAPGWYRHLWDEGAGQGAQVRWVARIGAALREAGHLVSTASLIEVQRLAVSLAALRDRPAPGFEELREASVACLMGGTAELWSLIEGELLLGNDVGTIPPDLPLAPLLDDLARQQKATRLKPEALPRELLIDLRSDAGTARSQLLHRLAILGVPWGRITDAGRSRGTFREKWLLAWEPELAVALVDNLVWGPTIAAAASGLLMDGMGKATTLAALAAAVEHALTADLPQAAQTGIALLETLAARTDDAAALLSALPALVDTLRYGTARDLDRASVATLTERIAVQAAIALPYAGRNLDAGSAAALTEAVSAAHRAIVLAEFPAPVREAWLHALAALSAAQQTNRQLAGCATRLLYEAAQISPEDVAGRISLALSLGSPVTEAAAYFEGFFAGASQRLIHDAALCAAVDGWMQGLDKEDFIAALPLFRRVFSELARTERQMLMQAALSGLRSAPVSADENNPAWEAHLATLTRILTGGGYP
jgi:Family of unknown function (DUF5682)